MFPIEVRWEFLPFCSILLPLTYSEDVYQFSTSFDRELLTSDSLRCGFTEEKDPIAALVEGKSWQAPLVDLRASTLGRMVERHCKRDFFSTASPRTACSISRSRVFYGESSPSHQIHNIHSICQEKVMPSCPDRSFTLQGGICY